MTEPDTPSRWRRLSAIYHSTALFVMNTLVLSLVAGVAFWTWAEHRPLNPGRLRRRDAVDVLHRGRTPQEVAALLGETWSRPVEYEPFTEFKERAYKGRYVNVDPAGFRLVKGQGPWPPSADFFNVFVFGGSTAFGYGVADDETIASFLQEALAGHTGKPARTYNFGRAFYYSSQERILCQQLSIAGFVPDLAVFIDGLNDFQIQEDAPWFTGALHAFMEQRAASRRNPLRAWWHTFSAVTRRGDRPPPSADEGLADRLIDRYLENKKVIEAVAEAYDIKVVFVWQPISMYRYDWNRHPAKDGPRPQPLPGVGARRMADRLQKQPLGRGFVWAADIQDAVPDPLYVDGVHYAPNLSRAVAQVTADALRERGYLE